MLCRDNPRPDVEPRARLLQAGTIFFQDVGNLSPTMQVRLADALSYAAAARGASGSRWRVMASTQEPLLPRVLDGTFDDRLYPQSPVCKLQTANCKLQTKTLLRFVVYDVLNDRLLLAAEARDLDDRLGRLLLQHVLPVEGRHSLVLG